MEDLNTFTLYKLIILYMLDKVDFSITRTQIFDFMLEKEYTDYFRLQSVMYELIEDELIESKSKRNASHLSITDKGRETIALLKNCIPDGIIEDLNSYFKDKEYQLRNELSIQSNYYKSTFGEYVAELTAKEREVELVSIRLTMNSEEAVAEMCENWQKKNQEIYAYLLENLL